MTEQEHQQFDAIAHRFRVGLFLLLWIMVILVFFGWLYFRATDPSPPSLGRTPLPAAHSPRDPAVEAGRVATERAL